MPIDNDEGSQGERNLVVKVRWGRSGPVMKAIEELRGVVEVSISDEPTSTTVEELRLAREEVRIANDELQLARKSKHEMVERLRGIVGWVHSKAHAVLLETMTQSEAVELKEAKKLEEDYWMEKPKAPRRRRF